MLVKTHSHQNIIPCLVCRKSLCNDNDSNVLKLCHGYVIALAGMIHMYTICKKVVFCCEIWVQNLGMQKARKRY